VNRGVGIGASIKERSLELGEGVENTSKTRTFGKKGQG
jgi:hypothetical protein